MSTLSKMRDHLLLPLIYFESKRFERREEQFNQGYYSQDNRFRSKDEALLSLYRKSSPYKLSKAFLKELGEKDIHQYGETPLKVYEMMARRFGLNQDDYFLELGCGRARGGFFLEHFFGCRYLGIDWVSEFIHRARMIQRTFYIKNVSFQCVSMMNASFGTPTWVYLHGATFSDQLICDIVSKLKTLGPIVKLMTVSFPLQDYDDAFEIIDEIELDFPFGKTSLFFNQLRG